MTTRAKEVQETAKGVEIALTTCKHKDGDYSLELVVESGHVTVTSYPWSHREGSHTSITVFDFTIDGMKKLGQQIIETAIRLELEEQ